MTTRAQVTVQAQGTQGPPGLQWRGNYDATSAYNVRDLIRDADQNIIYIVVQEIPANSNFLLTNEAYFNVFSVQLARSPGLQWRGEFDENADYEENDLVRNPADNSVYIFERSVSRTETVNFEDTATVTVVLRGLTLTDADILAVNSLSPVSSDITTLSPVSTEIGNLGPVASDISVAASNSASITTVATNLNQGASSEVVIVGDNISDVTTVATEINNGTSPLNTALSNATAAASSASAASTSETNAASSAATAATSETNAATSFVDVQKIAINPHNSQYTLSDSTTGYSALHYATNAQTSATEVNNKFVGSYGTSSLPTNSPTGAIAYDSTTSRLVVWDGTQWLTGLEGPQGISGGGINSITYDAFSDTLNIIYDSPGTVVANDFRIGTQDIDFVANQIYYSNVFSSTSAFPSATTYPGMLIVAQDTGKLFVSKSGGWYEVTTAATATLTN